MSYSCKHHGLGEPSNLLNTQRAAWESNPWRVRTTESPVTGTRSNPGSFWLLLEMAGEEPIFSGGASDSLGVPSN